MSSQSIGCSLSAVCKLPRFNSSRFRAISVLASALLSVLATFTAHAEPTIKGEWKQGGILIGQTKPGYQIQIDGKDVRVSNDGHFVFGVGRDHKEPVTVTEINAKGAPSTFTFPVTTREYKLQRIEGVQQKHVTPPKAFYDRINKEAKLVKKARAKDEDRQDFLVPFIWPAKGSITGVYGSQRIYNGVPKRPHFGVDIGGPVGTPIIAPAPGVVRLAEPDLYYSGGTLIIDHGHGLSSTFIHLDKVIVKVGDRVEQGDKIAEMGATGRATGPHLDWRINWFDVRLDPQLLMGDNLPNQ